MEGRCYANGNFPGVVYGSTLLAGSTGYEVLRLALEKLRDSFDEARPNILWSLFYAQHCNPPLKDGETIETSTEDSVMTFPEHTVDLAFDDGVLEDVKKAWATITGYTSGFMQFDDREVGAYEDEDD